MAAPSGPGPSAGTPGSGSTPAPTPDGPSKRAWSFRLEGSATDVVATVEAMVSQLGLKTVKALQHVGGGFIVSMSSKGAFDRAVDAGLVTVAGADRAIIPLDGNARWLTILDLPTWVEWSALTTRLEEYGKILVKEWVYYKPEELGGSKEQILTGARRVKIQLKNPTTVIPNLILVNRNKVRVYYPGVKKMCFRCGGEGHLRKSCPNRPPVTGTHVQNVGVVSTLVQNAPSGTMVVYSASGANQQPKPNHRNRKRIVSSPTSSPAKHTRQTNPQSPGGSGAGSVTLFGVEVQTPPDPSIQVPATKALTSVSSPTPPAASLSGVTPLPEEAQDNAEDALVMDFNTPAFSEADEANSINSNDLDNWTDEGKDDAALTPVFGPETLSEAKAVLMRAGTHHEKSGALRTLLVYPGGSTRPSTKPSYPASFFISGSKFCGDVTWLRQWCKSCHNTGTWQASCLTCSWMALKGMAVPSSPGCHLLAVRDPFKCDQWLPVVLKVFPDAAGYLFYASDDPVCPQRGYVESAPEPAYEAAFQNSAKRTPRQK